MGSTPAALGNLDRVAVVAPPESREGLRYLQGCWVLGWVGVLVGGFWWDVLEVPISWLYFRPSTRGLDGGS